MADFIPTVPVAADTPPSRDGPVVTQTITRSHTTITAVVTLGRGPTLTPTSTTTSAVSPTSSVPVSVMSQPTALTGAQIGAIAGAVGGFVIVALLLWYCVSTSRRRGSGRSDSSSGYGSSSDDNGPGYDPWARVRAVPPQHPTELRRKAPPLVPPPTRFPPTPRYTPYRQTRHPQMGGVRRYP